MNNMNKKTISQIKQTGAALVEYALLVALISVVSITAIQTIGSKATLKLESVASKLNVDK